MKKWVKVWIAEHLFCELESDWTIISAHRTEVGAKIAVSRHKRGLGIGEYMVREIRIME